MGVWDASWKYPKSFLPTFRTGRDDLKKWSFENPWSLAKLPGSIGRRDLRDWRSSWDLAAIFCWAVLWGTKGSFWDDVPQQTQLLSWEFDGTCASYFQISYSWKPHQTKQSFWFACDFAKISCCPKHSESMNQCVYPTRFISLFLVDFFW